MRNAWIETEWNELCRRLQRRARCCGQQDLTALEEFISQPLPASYLDFLHVVRSAAEMVQSWPECEPARVSSADDAMQSGGDKASTGDLGVGEAGYDIVDEASDESFPASDPPAWTGATTH